MKKLFVLILLVSNAIHSFGGINPCSPTIANFQNEFVNYDASGNGFSGVSSDICIDNSSPDFWIEFTLTGSSSFYLLMNSSSTTQANIALYEGDCNNPLQVLCYSGGSCTNDLPQLEISGLISGSTYYLKIWSDTNLSDFDLYLNTILPDYEILPSIDYYCAADNGGWQDACYTFQAEGGGSALAWLPDMVDFNQSLNHRAEVRFDTPLSNPTEQGMTMVYSNYAPTSCFDAGLADDIFTTNFSESFIIELNVEEDGNHFCRVSVNGAIGLNVLAGPVTVNGGDLQDGQFHNLDFKWYPITNGYEVYFDGALLFSGTYDIINNCLAGSNLTNRGYTGYMPSSNNLCCSYVGPEEVSLVSTSSLSICNGESVTIGGVTYSDDGLAVTQSTDNQGCPSYAFTVVSVSSASDTALGEIVICEDAPFEINGSAYSTTGDYEVVLESTSTSCDSTVSFSIVNITPNATISGSSEVNCTNEMVDLSSQMSIINPDAVTTYLWEKDGQFYSDMASVSAGEGVYTLTISSELDGVICTDTESKVVFLIPDFTAIINAPADTLCIGECITLEVQPSNGNYTYLWDNDSTSTSITVCPEITTGYSVTVSDVNDCEQVASTTVAVYPTSNFELLNEQMCIGDTLDVSAYSGYEITLSNPALAVVFNDNLLALNAGVIDLILTDVNGCLQQNTELFVTIFDCDSECESVDTLLMVSVCPGESFAGYSEEGMYVDTFSIGDMCDSIVTIDLSILPIYFDSINVDLCFGESYNGIDSSTMFLDTLSSISGCDSIVHTSVFVQPLILDSIGVEICEGEDFMGYTASGTYLDSLTASSGCDSLQLINVSVIPSIVDSLAVEICEGDDFLGNTSSGIYQISYSATNGCDSLVVLSLDVIPFITTTESITICEGEDYQGYTEAGVYQDTLISSIGCDSIFILDLMIEEFSNDTLVATICEGDSLNGYTTTGQYLDTLFSPSGCPILSVFELTVVDVEFEEFDTVICPMDTLFGLVITQEGIYEFLDTSPIGCEIVYTVSVTFNEEDCTVDTYNIPDILAIRVFPNPTTGMLYLETDAVSDLEYQLFDVNGALVASGKGKAVSATLDLGAIENGIYILKTSSNNKQAINRIVKME